jgi:hypothetical protein
MSDITDPKLVTDLIQGMDGDYHDGEHVFVSAEPGGYGSTSASCWVTVTDADSSASQRFLVRVDLEETDEDEAAK